jgi:hypothetical protein
MLLEHRQSLFRGEREHPANECEINAVVAEIAGVVVRGPFMYTVVAAHAEILSRRRDAVGVYLSVRKHRTGGIDVSNHRHWLVFYRDSGGGDIAGVHAAVAPSGQ